VWDSSLVQGSRKPRGVAGVNSGTSWIANSDLLMCGAGVARAWVAPQGTRREGHYEAMLGSHAAFNGETLA
jgi:hypothetical protein